MKRNNALRQALAPMEQKSLPSNFAYTTLRRIHQEQREKERQQHIVAIAVVVAVSLLGIGLLVYAFGAVLWQSLAATLRQPGALSSVLPTLFCLTFFALLNHWLSRRYGSGIVNSNLSNSK